MTPKTPAGPVLEPGPAAQTTLHQRFARRLKRAESGCLEWQGTSSPEGYGRISRGGRGEGSVTTHRLAWELAHGPIPAGMCVLHRCDNPPCCDVTHLFLGSIADNNADMRAKGRGKVPGGHNRRLSSKDVEEIRRLIATGMTASEVGARYNITRQYAWQVAAGARREA